MNTLVGEILTLPKMSGSVSTPKSLSGNVGAKTINIGGKGDDGATFIPSVSVEGVISWTNDKDLPNPEPVNIKGEKGDKGDKGDRGLQGVQGVQGERGEQGQKGDKGDTGEPGPQGIPGDKGEKGDKGDPGPAGADGRHGKDGAPGKDGVDGQPGKDGADGQPGADGISPVVSVEDIDGGHRVTITDKDGEKTFDVMDGNDGTGGGGGAQADWSVNDPEAAGYVKNRTHYEVPPAFDIQWDGDMTDRFALDMSAFGYPQGSYLVKVSDIVPNVNDVIGGVVRFSEGTEFIVSETDINFAVFPGAFVVGSDLAVITDQSTLNEALGLPDGYIQNGTYSYFYFGEDSMHYVHDFTAKIELKKIDEKFLPDSVVTDKKMRGIYLFPHCIKLDDKNNFEFVDHGFYGEMREEERKAFLAGLNRGVGTLDLEVQGSNTPAARFFLHDMGSCFYQGSFVVWLQGYLTSYLVCVYVQVPDQDGYEMRVWAKPLN